MYEKVISSPALPFLDAKRGADLSKYDSFDLKTAVGRAFGLQL